MRQLNTLLHIIGQWDSTDKPWYLRLGAWNSRYLVGIKMTISVREHPIFIDSEWKEVGLDQRTSKNVYYATMITVCTCIAFGSGRVALAWL